MLQICYFTKMSNISNQLNWYDIRNSFYLEKKILMPLLEFKFCILFISLFIIYMNICKCLHIYLNLLELICWKHNTVSVINWRILLTIFRRNITFSPLLSFIGLHVKQTQEHYIFNYSCDFTTSKQRVISPMYYISILL